MDYRWDFSVIWAYRFALLNGLLTTLELTALAIFAGTALAIPVTAGLVHRSVFIRTGLNFAVQIVRGLPLLVSLVFAYYVLPTFVRIELPAFATAAIVLSINLAAFIADILRGGILSIPSDHIDAGMAIGMNRVTILKRIIIPETFRRSAVSLISLYISLLKYSTLASVISVSELLRTAELIMVEKFRPLEIYLSIAVLYLAVIVPASYLSQIFEKHHYFALFPRSKNDHC